MNNNLKFPTNKNYTKKDIKRVQNRLLEMSDKVLGILDDNNIKYIIAYGTLLGSIRHKGFIPWDDDLDIYIFDEDYDKALEVLRNNLPKDMIVHDKLNDPIYWPYWSRVRDLKSETIAELWPNDNKYKYTGINFDLYKLERVKEKDALKKIYKHNLEHQNSLKKSRIITKKQCIKNKIKIYPKYIKEIIKSKFSHKNDIGYSFVIKLPFIKEKDVLPIKKYEFEGRKLNGPNNSDEMLKIVYGEYNSLPSYNKRNPHYSKVIFK